MLWNDDEELEAIITVMESDSDDHDSGIVAEVIIRNPPPAAGGWGLTPLQKICSSVRQLTSGVSSAEHDDKYRMAASTGMDAMKHFVMLLLLCTQKMRCVHQMLLISIVCWMKATKQDFLVASE